MNGYEDPVLDVKSGTSVDWFKIKELRMCFVLYTMGEEESEFSPQGRGWFYSLNPTKY